MEVLPLASKFTPSFLNYTKISTEFTQTLYLVLMLMKIIVNLCFELKLEFSRLQYFGINTIIGIGSKLGSAGDKCNQPPKKSVVETQTLQTCMDMKPLDTSVICNDNFMSIG